MPTDKDLKRLVRDRMKKTGESYTTARAQLLKKKTHVVSGFSRTVDLAKIAGMSDASVKKATGCTWAKWVKALDSKKANEMSHREIAELVHSFGVPSWWTQMVTVGYERIRGLREKGQQRSGGYQTTKSRTFGVSLARLYAAFADASRRSRWLDAKVTMKSATPNKRMRLAWDDGTSAIAGFYATGPAKSMVAVEHEKLPTKAAADAMKQAWGGHFDRLGELLSE